VSVQASSFVWSNSKHKGSALLLLLFMADCAHEDGSSIFPSVATMAKQSRLSERNVQYVLRHLIKSGELIEEGVSEWQTKVYRIPCIAPVQTLHPATERTQGVQGSVENEALGCTQSVIRKPSKKPINVEDGDVSFDAFYFFYPRHEAKADALKAWKALRPDAELVKRMSVDVRRYKDKEPKYIPLPATYLRGRRWEDASPVVVAARPIPQAIVRARSDNAAATRETFTPEQIAENKAKLAAIREGLKSAVS
jgi:hypothetical protein